MKEEEERKLRLNQNEPPELALLPQQSRKTSSSFAYDAFELCWFDLSFDDRRSLPPRANNEPLLHSVEFYRRHFLFFFFLSFLKFYLSILFLVCIGNFNYYFKSPEVPKNHWTSQRTVRVGSGSLNPQKRRLIQHDFIATSMLLYWRWLAIGLTTTRWLLLIQYCFIQVDWLLN